MFASWKDMSMNCNFTFSKIQIYKQIKKYFLLRSALSQYLKFSSSCFSPLFIFDEEIKASVLGLKSVFIAPSLQKCNSKQIYIKEKQMIIDVIIIAFVTLVAFAWRPFSYIEEGKGFFLEDKHFCFSEKRLVWSKGLIVSCWLKLKLDCTFQ